MHLDLPATLALGAATYGHLHERQGDIAPGMEAHDAAFATHTGELHELVARSLLNGCEQGGEQKMKMSFTVLCVLLWLTWLRQAAEDCWKIIGKHICAFVVVVFLPESK